MLPSHCTRELDCPFEQDHIGKDFKKGSEYIEFLANLLDYLLQSNKSNMNQTKESPSLIFPVVKFDVNVYNTLQQQQSRSNFPF